MKPGRVEGHFKQRRKNAISLAAFAGAKKSTYDKTIKKDRERNLNAKKVNQYRKWLAKEGIATPKSGFGKEAENKEETTNVSKRKRTHLEKKEDEEKEFGDMQGEGSGRASSAGGSKAKEPTTRHTRKPTALQKLHEKVQAEQAARQDEQAKIQLEKEERIKAIKAAQESRKKHTELMRKKTRKGQPVMKHRISSLLEKIESSVQKR